MSTLVPVILAGGSGTRLWPLSREAFPKQLARLVGTESLLQATLRRLLERAPAERIVLVGAEAHDHLVRAQLTQVAANATGHRLLEPVGRNTAAAIGLAALYVSERFGPETLLWVCPSDHVVDRPEVLFRALDAAIPAAADGSLLTFGITPDRPETGYGYIQTGGPIEPGSAVLRVVRFVEKPDRKRAEGMIAQGGHLWNSGIFLFRADRILAELETFEPAIREGVEHAFLGLERNAGACTIPEEIYREIPAAPIDKAVMERSSRVAVVPCEPEWSDLGSWQALWERLPKDGRGNAIEGDVWLQDTDSCLIRADGRLVACAGIRDIAVIETEDALLIADRTSSDAIRTVVGHLKGDGRREALAPRAEHHPWGSIRVLERARGTEIRVIELEPGAQVDLEQTPHLRHLVIGDQGIVIRKPTGRETPPRGQSTPIPGGVTLTLANEGEATARAVEIGCIEPDA